MSFYQYLLIEIAIVLFALATLPLWLPVWCYFTARNWYGYVRYGWERMEANRRHDDSRGSPPSP